jgi:hypothetical protein
MTISDNLQRFAGREVVDFGPDTALDRGPEAAYRLRLDWDAYDKGGTMAALIEQLLAHPRASEVEVLLIGAWDFESSVDASAWLPTLCTGAARLPRLRALMLGDITGEEQEISWIKQSNVGPARAAFPGLEVLHVRGGDGLDIDPLRHGRLKVLVVETGGLPRVVLERVANAHLPALEHLELWLGTSDYGYDGTTDDLRAILAGGRFPALRYLGLRDSEVADEVAAVVAGSPILDQIQELDLSLGTLGWEGVSALMRDPRVRNLRKLDIHHHYLDRDSVARLMALGIEVDASEPQEADEGDRYCAVSE